MELKLANVAKLGAWRVLRRAKAEDLFIWKLVAAADPFSLKSTVLGVPTYLDILSPPTNTTYQRRCTMDMQ